MFDRLSALQRSLVAAFAGFLFYGAWAFAINFAYGQASALKAAAVQGSYSFVLTLSMTLVLEAIFKFMSHFFNQRWLIDWTTVLAGCALVFSGSWIVNVMAGTPEIFKTVILGYVVGGFYCAVYVRGLARASKGAHE
ncbi:hypothetical protein [Arenicella xantha]|uniref:Uncharacterized protein n=1 Tax=Arenicella xantha TaxID=644221 RepID=A0A395JLQ4_9GAMM|nr:hypothetical protein [Arenicella xantha]RBP51355.1 hypothetical protein DFR28_102775 [Arenicella xantha]